MKPFIKFVEKLDQVQQAGINEHFYQGDDYSVLSSPMAERLEDWCSKHLGVTSLRPDAGSKDEPVEVYVVKIGTKAGSKELKELVTNLGSILVDTVLKSANRVDAANIMTNEANEAFDLLEEAAKLRTALFKVVAKASQKPGRKAVLLLNV